MRYIPKFGGIELNRSLSQLSYRPIYEAVLFPVRCYDPENIDIIAAFGTFVKAFFQILPAQIGSARGSLVLHAQLVAADDLSLVGSGGGGVALQRDQAGVDRVDDPFIGYLISTLVLGISYDVDKCSIVRVVC